MNNDRFKFRVWDEQNKRYAYNYSLDADGVVWNGRGVNREATIEQCTGLRDKNGTLIYEGDIVVLDGNPPLRVMWHYCEWSLFGDGYACRCNSWEESEVVGNIHEREAEK